MYYEVLWYVDVDETMLCDSYNDYRCREFKTKKEAMSFYELHKNDINKYGWWVTKRNRDGEVVEDLIY